MLLGKVVIVQELTFCSVQGRPLASSTCKGIMVKIEGKQKHTN